MQTLIRPATPEDENFIFKSWLESFKSSRYAGPIPNNLYYTVYQAAIHQILERSRVRIYIICNPERHEQIYGYMVAEPGILHWIYVKRVFRNLGLANQMIDLFLKQSGSDKFFYTFRTAMSGKLFKNRNATFNPMKARLIEKEDGRDFAERY